MSTTERPPAYRVERRDDGELRLYRGPDLVDRDRDNDGDTLADIEGWAANVAWAEDYTVIQRWEQNGPHGRWHTLHGISFRYVSFEFDVGSGVVTVWDELDSTNQATRHIEAVDQRYTVAAALSEVIAARDSGGTEAVRKYEERYGVAPEARYPADAEPHLSAISGREFVERWDAARREIERAGQA